ncbi:family 16 glycoside hydrolase [Rhodohalobacter sp. 8-1]|uniref:family 16 glycoside hydrolase n=1 Tax=Rhodohalobacter sp. 8-1 TaxID=3131972 RepID=UPI0030ED1CB2
MPKTQFCILFVVLFLSPGLFSALQAQTNELPFTEMELTNLDSFQEPSENWQLAGDVFMDTYQDLHVEALDGSGVLVNTAEGDEPQDIYTSWEHGDLDLSFHFMMAKESNSGIYLQGRYEIQLFDSWGVNTPKFSDLGGIYQWWEDGRGVGGTAPNVNAALAPGVWQYIEIKFRAPDFNEQGQKIANARLEEVILNGKVIHADLELIHPTGGAISNEEAPQGPLRIQGDHGPVAIKNIRYKRYDNPQLDLTDITYRYYEMGLDEGENPVSIIASSNLKAEGTAVELSLDDVQRTGEFAIVYESTVDVAETGTYLFELRTDGGNRFEIDGNQLIENGADNGWWNPDRAEVDLSEGTHTVTITYFRGEDGDAPVLSLMAEGPGIQKHALHAPSAFPRNLQSVNLPKRIDPEDKPVVMHGFLDMPDRVHPHSAAVGFPDDIHFGIDLNNGTLMKLWKGGFLDVSTMWVGRGGGNLSLNEEAALTFSGAPSMAFLDSRDAVWPDSLQENVAFDLNSYRFGDENQLILNYQLNGSSFEDHLSPDNDGREFMRTIRLTQSGPVNNLYLRIAAGDNITELLNGLFQVNDKTYLVNLSESTKRESWIRRSGGVQELLVPVSNSENAEISYSYVW